MLIRKSSKLLLLAAVMYVTVGLAVPFHKTSLHRSVKHQITYLVEEMDHGLDDHLQEQYPEGKVFSNAILAMSIISWCNDTGRCTTYEAAAVDRCLARLMTEATKSNFSQDIQPQYGVFYLGWTAWTLRMYLSSSLIDDSTYADEFESTYHAINKDLSDQIKERNLMLERHQGSIWPTDNLVGMLAIDSKVLRQGWLQCIRDSTGHETGLLKHEYNRSSDIRGSSSALNLYLLHTLEDCKKEDLYTAFDSIFVDKIFGIQLVREYPDGINDCDYDSGPVLMGYGASATVMNIKTKAALRVGNPHLTWELINVAGLPVNLCGRKYYLAKQQPMLDLFLLWSAVELL